MGGDGGETKQCTLHVVNTDRGLLLGRELEANRKLFADDLPSCMAHSTDGVLVDWRHKEGERRRHLRHMKRKMPLNSRMIISAV